MKQSNITTPRTLADCSFVYGYTSIRPMAYREPKWEKVAGYLLAAAIGVSLAVLLVLELSK
jgi:hypothetical protein